MKLADYSLQKLMKMRFRHKIFPKMTVILQSPTTTWTSKVYNNSQRFVVIFLDLLFLLADLSILNTKKQLVLDGKRKGCILQPNMSFQIGLIAFFYQPNMHYFR